MSKRYVLLEDYKKLQATLEKQKETMQTYIRRGVAGEETLPDMMETGFALLIAQVIDALGQTGVNVVDSIGGGIEALSTTIANIKIPTTDDIALAVFNLAMTIPNMWVRDYYARVK